MASGSRADAKPCIPFPIPKNRSIAQVTAGLVDIPIERDETPAQFTPAPVSLGTVTTEGRDRIRDCIARALSLLSEEDYERYKVSFKASNPSKVAAQVEAALFQFEHSRPDDDKPLEVKRQVLLDTLRRNKDLRRQVLFGEITPEMLLNMPIAELRQKYPANSRQILLPPSRERRVIRLCIAGGLSKVSEEVDEGYMDSVNASDPSKVAAQVEAALFKHWGPDETMEPVAYRYSLLITLINIPWNKDLRRQVLLGEITPEMLANMSLAEMQQLNTWPEDDPVILI
ncbi:hypothetical protein FF1_031211 [Malus domestica]|uniref:transcription elongation factor TFIIS-like n=1 Tax=Malus domestica TaxID=3750 RepID=UPI0021ACA026|nr:transcription elongation factor TFIIS-like [Malus sylvestris]